MSLAKKLKNARMNKNITQEQAAQELMVSRQTISNWENEKSLPDILNIIKMSELYELSLDELLKRDQEMMKKMEKEIEINKVEKKLMRFAWLSIISGIILIIFKEIFKGNDIVEFLNGATPWVLLSLVILFAILYLNKKKTE